VQAWTPPPGGQGGGAVEQFPVAAPSTLPPAAAALVEWAAVAESAHQLALQLCETSFVPAVYFQQPGLATAAMLAGSELGLSPIQALMSFDVIDGRPAPRALTLRALLEQQGHLFIVDTSTAKVAKGRAKRRGTSEWQHASYTWEQAERRGLTRKRNWQTQPEDMLVARLTGRLARLVAADSILGIPYTADELEDLQDTPTTRVAAAKRVRVQRVAPAAGSEPDRPDPDANYPADQPESPPPGPGPDDTPPTGPPPPSEAQVRMMWALIGERFGDTRDDRVREQVLEHMSLLLDRAVDTTRGLSGDEVSTVITDLSQTPDAPEGTEQ
jgi:hypothetical protein